MQADRPLPDPAHDYPPPIGGLLVGLFPFLISTFGLVVRLTSTWLPHSKTDAWVTGASVLAWLALLILITAAAAGWGHGFPAWSLPAWAILLLLTAYLPNVALPGLVFFGYTFGRDVLGVVGFMPLLAVIVAALLIDHTLRPLRALARGVARDWTRVSFAFYTLTVLLLRLSFDEVQGEENFLLSLDLALAVGALIYLTSQEIQRRAVALLAALVIVWIAAALYLGVYWNGRQESWMPQPGNGVTTASGQLVFAGVIVLITFLPGILSRLRRRGNS